MSFKTEVQTREGGEWSTNAVRFATEKEAVEAGHELLSRWMVPIASRASPSDDPVNYRFDFEKYRPVMIEGAEFLQVGEGSSK